MSVSPPPSKPASTTIDRQVTTPFLLTFCYRSSAFHNLTDFPLPTPSNPHPHLPAHLQIYTWMSCTLRELALLLTTALPNIVPSPAIGTRLAFRLVYPDMSVGRGGGGPGGGRLLDEGGRGRYISREMGSVVISAAVEDEEEGSRNGDAPPAGPGKYELGGEDADKTLENVRFVIGDFVDCAVFAPLSDGSVVSRGSVSGMMRGGTRENGYGRGRGGGGGGYGMGGRGRGDFGSATIPSGEWRRGERLPDGGGYRGGGGGSGYAGGRGRGRPY